MAQHYYMARWAMHLTKDRDADARCFLWPSRHEQPPSNLSVTVTRGTLHNCLRSLGESWWCNAMTCPFFSGLNCIIMSRAGREVFDEPTQAAAALVGHEVEIHGLASKPDLNGRIGRVTGVSGSERVAVNIPGTAAVALKPSNLKRLSRLGPERPAHYDEDARLAKGCDMALNKSDPCGDGDQSPLVDGCDSPGQIVRETWANGADCNPWRCPPAYSKLFAACAHGDVLSVTVILSQDFCHNDLERRESKLRYSPLHVCVAGSRVAYGSSDWPKRKSMPPLPELVPDHCAVAKLLIERRARTEACAPLGPLTCHQAGLTRFAAPPLMPSVRVIHCQS